ncbi:Probable aspartic proteinase GIP2 [Linum perenne]
MVSLPILIFFSLSLLLYYSHVSLSSQISSSNLLLLLPIAKDPSTHHFTTFIHRPQSHLLQPIKLVVDLGGPSLWLHCSSLSPPLPRRSIQCIKANSHGAGHLSTSSSGCYLENRNAVLGLKSRGELVQAPVSVQTRDGSTETVDRFLFSCGSTLLLNGLPSGAVGMIGLGGRSHISLTAQFAAWFGFTSRRFAACFPSYNGGGGVLAFGNSPIEAVFGPEISRYLLYTPLVDVVSSSAGNEYFINLKSIRIDGERVSVNRDRIGLAKLSTTNPYTLMESSLYRVFKEAYLKATAMIKMRRVKPVSPFDLCFSRSMNDDWVPAIDLALQSEMVKWRIEGSNSMVSVDGGEEEQVMCLGILEGGSELEAAVVIGVLQMEDRVMEFDLDGSRLGFSSHLSTMEQRTCSDFISQQSFLTESSS